MIPLIPLVISPDIQDKLANKHKVQGLEVQECFLNHEGKYLIDTRENHATDPPTLWFVGQTHRGRCLKVIFVHRDGNLYLKSAYDANDAAKRIYKKLTTSN